MLEQEKWPHFTLFTNPYFIYLSEDLLEIFLFTIDDWRQYLFRKYNVSPIWYVSCDELQRFYEITRLVPS